VFPAYAGVFLMQLLNSRHFLSVPRIRGGVPVPENFSHTLIACSPHTRGCSLAYLLAIYRNNVFPAYAGVFPSGVTLSRRARSVPRIRGGVPNYWNSQLKGGTCSPHTRGCSQFLHYTSPPIIVFPAYAGVFPPQTALASSDSGVPRIRGGVPD